MSKLGTSVIAALLILTAACVTVNLNFNFPQKEMQEQLYKQEKEVGGENEKKPDAPKTDGDKDKKNNAAAFDPVVLVAAPQGDDKKPDLKVRNPAIDKINESRKARADKIKSYLSKGWLGEGNEGKLEKRDDNGLEDRESAEFERNLKEENKDREKLIKEILKANNYDDKQLGKVAAAFAQARKRYVDEGTWIETKERKWKKKTKEDQKLLDEGKDVEK